MSNKFGLGALIVVALGWAGALSYLNGRFQTELRLGFASLPASDSIVRPDNSSNWQPMSARVESEAGGQMASASFDSRTSDEASVNDQPPESSCAQLLAAIAQADPDTKSAAIEKFVRSISSADLQAALNSLKSNAGSDAGELLKRLIARWAEQDASAAANWLAQVPESPASREALVQVAVAWANSDLAGATAWANALPEGAGKQQVLLSLANEAARTDSLTALGLAATLPPSPERDDSLVHAISQWAGTDALAAIAWAEKVADPNLRQRLLGAAAIAAASQDGPVGANLVTSGLLQGDEQDRAMVAVVQRWAQRSPAAAAAWLTQFPDSQPRDTALQHLMTVWAGQDPAAAQNWVRQLPAGSLRNAASSAYAQFISGSGGAGLAAFAPNL